MTTSDITPLLAWLRVALPVERDRLAMLAGTSGGYLYQLATCKRPHPSAELALAIEDASKTLHTESAGRLPLITVRELATMCAMRGMSR